MKPTPQAIAGAMALTFAIGFSLIAIGSGEHWFLPAVVAVCLACYGAALFSERT